MAGIDEGGFILGPKLEAGLSEWVMMPSAYWLGRLITADVACMRWQRFET